MLYTSYSIRWIHEHLHRARTVLGLFSRAGRITTTDVAHALGLSARMVRVLLAEWVDEGLLVAADPSRKKRCYELTVIYRQYLDGLSAMKRAE